ncbi:MAG: PRC-barrel domain-containing protein [Planctomycetota bacterium]
MNTTPNSQVVLSASTLTGDQVTNRSGEELGKIQEIMLDANHGRIAYAVLSFGGFLGLGNKLFAIPWDMLSLNVRDKCFILDVTKQQLENAPGFDKDAWPSFADSSFHESTYKHWGRKPYWQTAS